jgi:23S rRNA pseudouridine1911/1915/1917 synthase
MAKEKEHKQEGLDEPVKKDDQLLESDVSGDGSDSEQSDDYFERQEFVADPKQSQIRLDKFLMDRLSNQSRSRVQTAIRAGSVKVNDQEVKPNYKVKPGNHVSIVFPRSQDADDELLAQNIPVDIPYEDEDILIVNKPSGMAVHPGVGIPNGTLVNAIAWHLRENPIGIPVKEGNDSDRAGLVHRIDKDTTGLLVMAKNDFAMNFMANQFFNHTIERKYWALVWGDVEQDSGTIVGNIGRNPNDRKLFMVFPEGEDGKHAVTHYKVIERFYYVTLVECQLETGRTHQIRVHMKSIGHTLFGDPRYGGDQILKGTVFSKYKQFVENCLRMLPRQALHAKVLGFTHPTTGEHMHFESELPEDMKAVMDKWRTYVGSRIKDR